VPPSFAQRGLIARQIPGGGLGQGESGIELRMAGIQLNCHAIGIDRALGVLEIRSIVELPTDEVLVIDFRVGSALSVRRLPPR
jgi:hypothetical protein